MHIPADAAINSFIEYLRYEKRYSEHTVLAYGEDLAQFRQFIERQYDIPDPLQARSVHIRSWMAELAEQGVKARSINRKLSCLRSFYTHGRRTGILAVNPATDIRVLKTPARLPTFIEERQMRVLLEDVAFPAGFEGMRERLIVEMLYQTGVRVGELLKAEPADIDFGGRTLKVIGKGRKERIIPLSEGLVGQLRTYLREKGREEAGSEGGCLFETAPGKPMTARRVYGIVRRYLSLVTTAPKRSPHVLRHSFATHLTDHGADLNAVKELLGHASLAATQVYTHNSIGKLREAHRKAHPKA